MSVNCPNCPQHPDQGCIRTHETNKVPIVHIHSDGVKNHEYTIQDLVLSELCPKCPRHKENCIRTSPHTMHKHEHAGAYHEYPDLINHPPHYNEGNIEVIDFIEDKKLGFHLGNVVKYICRESKGNYLEDLEKAKWYLDREVARQKEEAAKID